MYSTSVALCTYNGAHYIIEQLQSITDQTVVPQEIIICDDRSSDDTVKLINDFAKGKAISIKVFVNEVNLGVKDNFEKALRFCTNDIIFLADQDDVWEPKKVEKILEYFAQHLTIDVVFTDGFLLSGKEKTTDTIWESTGFTKALQGKLSKPEALLNFLVYERNLATGATMAMRSAILPRHLPFVNFKGCLHDYLLALQAAAAGSLGFIDDKLTSYRIHSAQQVGFNAFKIPAHLKPFYNIPVIGIKSILQRRIKNFKKVIARHLLQFTATGYPQLKRSLEKIASG